MTRMEGIHEGEITPFGGRLTGVVAGAKGLVLQARPLTFDRALSVRVAAPDGTPLKGVQVYVRDARGTLVPGANVLTDGSGAASLEGLPDGDIAVFAKAARNPAAGDWIDPSLFPVLAEGQTIALRFREGLRVRGKVVGAGGEAIAEAFVSLYWKTEMLKSTQTDAEGLFSLLVPKETEMPLKLVAQKWEGRSLLQAKIDRWEPSDGAPTFTLAAGR